LVARKFSRLEKNVSCLYFDSHTHTLFISIGLTKRISELQAVTKKKNASTKNQKKKTAVANDASSSALLESLGGGDPSKFIEFLMAQIQQKAAAQVVSPAERRRKYFEKIVVGKLKELLATANIAVKANLKKDDLVQLAVDCLQIKVPGMDDVSSTSVLISATTAMDTEAHQTQPPSQVQQIAASSESSHQALEDGAVEAAPKADSSSTSGLVDTTTVTLIQEGADSNDQQFTLTAGDIFTLRIEEYILSDKPTVRKDCKVLRIDQHPRLKRQVQIWYSYTWKARNGIIHNEDDGVLDIVFQDGMSN
jgi:hypothetical protein